MTNKLNFNNNFSFIFSFTYFNVSRVDLLC